MKHFSPILFGKLRVSHGKKGRATKTRIVKALVDSAASESIIGLKAAKNLPLKTKASSQNGKPQQETYKLLRKQI
jgi:hypothetical protein